MSTLELMQETGALDERSSALELETSGDDDVGSSLLELDDIVSIELLELLIVLLTSHAADDDER